jgi:hypothetical protein
MIVMIMKQRREMGGNVARMSRKSEGKRPLGRPTVNDSIILSLVYGSVTNNNRFRIG